MNYSRRPDERRRRVMMTAGAATPTPVTASSRRRMEQLREARRPQVAYGSRVRKCLRGRWFSLVPVDRSTYIKFLAGLALIVGVLVFFHDASVRYATLAEQPSWVDVLRINRYGSFGRYAISLLYLLVAGAAWLVYQLRRYRNDDFSGNYQLWQWIVTSALLASVSSAVPILGMLGAVIDWTLGQRAALSGEDWIELFLIVGGAILALRTIAEMWRYRWSTGFMVGGWFAMAIPTAADWNMIDVENLSRWTLVTSASLAAVAFWLAATVGYLRCLFREVRGIEPAPGLIQRLRVVADDWSSGSDGSETESPNQESPVASNSSKRTATADPIDPPKPKRPPTRVQPNHHSENESGENESGENESGEDESGEDDSDDEPLAKPRRSWWPFGRSKATDESADVETAEVLDSSNKDQDAENDEDSEDQPEPKKRKWWPSLKRRAKANIDDVANESDEVESDSDNAPAHEMDDQSETPTPKRRFGLGSIMKRRADSSTEAASDEEDSEDTSDAKSNSAQVNGSGADGSNDSGNQDDQSGDDDIDWASMNKAERRRMRKQLKRGGKAA